MNRHRLYVIAFVLVVAAGTAFAYQNTKTKTNLLDGKSFSIQLVEEGTQKGNPDTLTFKSGEFDSMACHKNGFSRSEYTAKQEENKIAFEVHATSNAKDQQEWKGHVEGNKIEGRMRLQDAAGAVTHYHFTGEIKES